MEDNNRYENAKYKQLLVKEDLLKNISIASQINKRIVEVQKNVLKNITIPKIQVDLKPLVQVQSNILESLEPINRISQHYAEIISKISKSTEYFSINIQEVLKSLGEVIGKLDQKKIITNLYLVAVEENQELINRFIKEEICPPINWIEDGVVFEDNNKNLRENLLSNKYEKQYDITFSRWIEFHDNIGIINTISEIKICFSNKMYNVAAISMCTVIDFLLRNYLFDKEEDPRYRDIKNRLKPLFESIKLGHVYNKFITENLYASTDKKQIFSRHELAHGCEFEFDAELTCLNLIFICDLIHSLVSEIA